MEATETPFISTRGLADNGKRFGAFFMDSVLVAMFAMILFAAVGAPIFSYYTQASQINQLIDDLDATTEATHILDIGDQIQPSSRGETSMGTGWNYVKSHDMKAEEDCLYYYHCVYAGKTLADYNALYDFSNENFPTLSEETRASYAQLYEVNSFNGLMGLKEPYKTNVAHYLDKSDSGAEATANYNTTLLSFKELYRYEWTQLGLSEPYHTQYRDYVTLNTHIRYSAGQAALVSYTLSALIVYVGLPFLIKKGRTFVKRVMKIQVISVQGKLIPWQVISRGLLETVEFSGLAVFAPFFFLQSVAFTLPIFDLGSLFTFKMLDLLLLSVMLTLLSGALTLFTKEKTSLHDLATFTRVVSSSAYDQAQLQKEERPEPIEHGNTHA